MKALRHFYRCADCLTIAVTAEAITPGRDARGYPRWAECAGCGGPVEYLGPVNKHHIFHTEFQSPCDGRCTNATGPSCDCQCGGENHGTGALVEVVVRVEGLPRVMTPADAAGKAEEFRALVKAYREVWDRLYASFTARKRAGDYLDGMAYGRYLDGQSALADLGKARGMRTHAGRNKRLRALTENLSRKYS